MPRGTANASCRTAAARLPTTPPLLTHCQHGGRLQRSRHPAGGPFQGAFARGGLRDGVGFGSGGARGLIERRRRRRPHRLCCCVVRPGGRRAVAAALGHGCWEGQRAAGRYERAARELGGGPGSSSSSTGTENWGSRARCIRRWLKMRQNRTLQVGDASLTCPLRPTSCGAASGHLPTHIRTHPLLPCVTSTWVHAMRCINGHQIHK